MARLRTDLEDKEQSLHTQEASPSLLILQSYRNREDIQTVARLRTELEDKEQSLHTQEASLSLLILLILPEQRGHPDGGEAEGRTGGQGAESSHTGGKSLFESERDCLTRRTVLGF